MEIHSPEKKIPCLVVIQSDTNTEVELPHHKPTSSPRLDPRIAPYRILPKLTKKEDTTTSKLKTEGWLWLRIRKQDSKKKEWKKRFIQVTVRGLDYGNDLKKKIKGVILFNTIKEVLRSPGKEPHLYQIHIICVDTLWELSLEKDKDLADEWYSTLQYCIDGKCFNVPRLVGIDLDESPRRKPIDLQKTIHLRKEFSLDGENALFEFKCNLLIAKDSVSGMLYITENYLCFSPKNNSKKFKITLNDISSLEFEPGHSHSTILLGTPSEKYQIVYKNKYSDQIIIIFYLWYHTPTYFSNDDIQKAISVYQAERKKK
jgi:hypothetical protein